MSLRESYKGQCDRCGAEIDPISCHYGMPPPDSNGPRLGILLMEHFHVFTDIVGNADRRESESPPTPLADICHKCYWDVFRPMLAEFLKGGKAGGEVEAAGG